ncbi:hypothetical protein MB46_03300 [Arthrobacter alpinus]|uniref:hypothetical protein n=1 Tax=Arthrobacter alpinus TaxID=656366 RepID=UPI0005CABF31|nr:hypothetical protein [Arthrobacter alpinus]ALV44683.1 hypothetical protein MB46_03300 [Arthrobacter alpinus]
MFHATRHSVGSDILLARHGSAISSLRLDRSRGQVVARLTDGSFDTAPNLIDPALQMPGRYDDDTKVVAIAVAAAVGLSVLLTSVIAVVYSLATPDQLDSITTMMAGYTPTL